MNSKFINGVLVLLLVVSGAFCLWAYMRWNSFVNYWGEQPLTTKTWLDPRNQNVARTEVYYFVLGNLVVAPATEDKYFSLAVRDNDAPVDSPAALPVKLPRLARREGLIQTATGLADPISPVSFSGIFTMHTGSVQLGFAKVIGGDHVGLEYSRIINLVK